MNKISFERREGGDRLTRIFPVRLHGSDTIDAEALDVSRTGLRIVCPRALAEDQSVRVELELEPYLKLSLTGKAIWQQELSRAGSHMVGLRFVGCQDAERHLYRWLGDQAEK